MHRAIASILAALLVPASGAAQHSELSAHPRVQEALHLLELWVDAQLAYQEIPGASMAVVHDQDVLWTRGFGLANREAQLPATPETIYSICSISKLFTSVGVMRLRDAGTLRLDDSVQAHLPWFDLGDRYPDAPPVTVAGMLTHSSGLPRESDHPYWSPPDFPFPSPTEIADALSNQQELYPAFAYWQYSNLGMALLGEIIATRSGQAYDAYIQASILDPLQMGATTPEIPVALRGERMALGYTAMTRSGERVPVGPFTAKGIAAAAGFASTVEDLAKFAQWQFRVLYHGADEILSRNTLREMHRVHWTDPDWERRWGLGFSTWRTRETTFVGHGGSCPGYRSHFALDPKGRVATIFMSNANGVSSSAFTNRAHQIVASAIAAALDSTVTAEAIDPHLSLYAGTYDESPWWGESAVFPWEGKLALMGLPTDDPIDELVQLEWIGDHTFRRIRDDGELGEEIRFEVSPDSTVTRMWRHGNYSDRLR
jgi:CubicO group peptidase (beta-lactamase class C family)